MRQIGYTASAYPVREDLTESHRRYWARLGAPGTWLTGAQRVAVAKEVRQAPRCGLCRRRKEALSPYGVAGDHDTVSELPPAMVEVVHRITTDPQRLSRTWFDEVMRQGLSAEEYVEVLGTLGAVIHIDEFCRGIGVAPHPLPDPQPGEPSRYRPARLEHGVAWVPLMPMDANVGAESDLWQAKFGNVLRSLSLVPDEVRSFNDLVRPSYLDPAYIWNVARAPQGTLSRMQTEVIAARVSAFNDCFY
jgi:hypothetical protein